MVFSFQALGLLISFLIIIIYYAFDKKNNLESSIYRMIMLGTYVLEFVYVLVYIMMMISRGVIISSKLYLIIMAIVGSLMVCYFVASGLRDKYFSKQSLFDKKSSLLKILIILFNILACSLILVLPVDYDNYTLSGPSVDLVHFFVCFYMIVEGMILIKYRRDLNSKRLSKLLFIWLINFLVVAFQLFFDVGTVLNTGFVIINLAMYLVLENSWSREVSRLQIERDHAVRNNMERSSFLTNMSHEIRTPLNTIDGFSQVIMDSDNIDSIKEDAEDIRIASKNLIDIINGIIDISIIESGKLEIVKENYNVYDMFDNVVNIANSRIKDKDVKFKAVIDKDIPDVLYGDYVRIEQVLLNIITNAIKATKRGSIKLNVDCVKTPSMCRLRMFVSDTGVGIKPDDLKMIFERMDYTGISDRDGCSLGLVVSRQLLDLMEGKLDVSSTYGKGSVFTITINQKISLNSDKVTEIKRHDVREFDTNGCKILIVDDNKLNMKVATRLMKGYNVNVTEAYSGQECLDVLDKDNSFDLILMDDMMPRMSGTETLDILHKIERIEGYKIPVVVLTANAISGMREKYLKAGFDDYLAKPIDKYELNRILKKFLKNKK